MEIVQPTKQKVWGWPAVANFILGGMAAGFYLLSFLLEIFYGDTLFSGSRSVVFKVLSPGLAGLGFLALTIEAGRPMRGYHLLRNLQSSWMSRETLAGVVFIIAAAVSWFFPHMVLRILTATAGFGLIVSQGFIVYRACAVIAWNVSLIPLIFVTSGFATGKGLLLLLFAGGKSTLTSGPIIIGLICVVLDLVVWLFYLYWSQDPDFRRATGILRHIFFLVSIIVVGHLLPVLLLLLLLLLYALDFDAIVKFQHIMLSLTGVAIIVGGISQKVGIILGAGYLRGIVLGQPKDGVQNVHPPTSVSEPSRLNYHLDTLAQRSRN